MVLPCDGISISLPANVSFFAKFTLHALCPQVSELNRLQHFIVLIFITNVFLRIMFLTMTRVGVLYK